MTREEAIYLLSQMRKDGDGFLSDNTIETYNMAIKALEQGFILDKIRIEIEQITDTMGVSYNQYVSKIDVLQIIDKYRDPQESEG